MALAPRGCQTTSVPESVRAPPNSHRRPETAGWAALRPRAEASVPLSKKGAHKCQIVRTARASSRPEHGLLHQRIRDHLLLRDVSDIELTFCSSSTGHARSAIVLAYVEFAAERNLFNKRQRDTLQTNFIHRHEWHTSLLRVLGEAEATRSK